MLWYVDEIAHTLRTRFKEHTDGKHIQSAVNVIGHQSGRHQGADQTTKTVSQDDQGGSTLQMEAYPQP